MKCSHDEVFVEATAQKKNNESNMNERAGLFP